MPEVQVDMRAVLEKQHNLAPRSSLVGVVDGPGAPLQSAEMPRDGVAMCKSLF